MVLDAGSISAFCVDDAFVEVEELSAIVSIVLEVQIATGYVIVGAAGHKVDGVEGHRAVTGDTGTLLAQSSTSQAGEHSDGTEEFHLGDLRMMCSSCRRPRAVMRG